MVASVSPSPDHTRPTLPPLSSLGLLDIRVRRSHPNIPAMHLTTNANANDVFQPDSSIDINESCARMRQCSISSTSSSATSSSRSSSPTGVWPPPPRRGPPNARIIRRHKPYGKESVDIRKNYRCILWNRFDDADAMLIIPLPPDAVDENNEPIPEKTKDMKIGRAVLVAGKPALALRDPEQRRRMRAIVHPYRLIPRESASQVAEPKSELPPRSTPSSTSV